MICTHHELSKCELLISPLLRKAHTDGRSPVFIYSVDINAVVVFFRIITNRNNSYCVVILTCETMNVSFAICC